MKTKSKKPSKKTIIILFIVFFLIATLVAQVVLAYHEAKQLKSNLSIAVEALKSDDSESMEASCKEIRSSAKTLRAITALPHWWLAGKLPVVGDDIESARILIKILDSACSNYMGELIKTVKEYPLNNLKSGDGFNAYALYAYANLFCDMMPKLDKYESMLNEVSFNILSDSSVAGYVDTLKSLLSSVDDYENYIYLLRDFVGDGEDKLYLFMAQNAAETRASGGFPGSVGLIEISNGVLTIGDFKPTNDVLPRNNSSEYTSTDNEFKLFSYWVQYPRDMCYNPNFERVAYVIAKNYELANDVEVDGVLAMTPVIIEDLLSVLGEITLSDGTVLDGTNATRFLQRDIYFKYLYLDEGLNSYYNLNLTDSLFTETASLTLKSLFSNLKISQFPEYFDVLQEGIDDRVVVMWFADEDTEQIVRDLGASGGLTTDENEPKVGVYFSCSDPCKLGWFLSIDTVIGDPATNKDGTLSYDVTLYLNNLLTKKERKSAGTYILGKHNGAIIGNLHIFAPTGGTISDVTSSSYLSFSSGEYEGLECRYVQGISISAATTLEIHFTVTTAKGVTTPLGVMHTPTINDN